MASIDTPMMDVATTEPVPAAVAEDVPTSSIDPAKITAWYEAFNDEAGRGRDNEMSRREVEAFASSGELTEDEQQIAEFVLQNRGRFDDDGNGRLNSDEFAAAVQAANDMANSPDGGGPLQHYYAHNDEAAKGRDNEMSKREIKSFRDAEGLSDEDRAIAEHIYDNRKVFDKDKNGRLNEEEFIAAYNEAKGMDGSEDPGSDPDVSSPGGPDRKDVDDDKPDDVSGTGGKDDKDDKNSDRGGSDDSGKPAPGGAKSVNWGERVDLWDITKKNVDQRGISNGADVFLVTVNDTELNKGDENVQQIAQDYGYEVVKTEGKKDAGVLLLRPTSDSDPKGLEEMLDFGKVTITAVNEPQGKRLVPNGGGFETRLNSGIGFGTTDNPKTKGEFFKTTGDNSSIIKNKEDDGRLWHSGRDMSGFRGGWMGLEWK